MWVSMLSTLLAACVFCALFNAVVIFIMSDEDSGVESVDNASMEAVSGDVCICDEPFPQFTFACADSEGYVSRHACDACKGYAWFDDNHSEICSMSIEQYAEFKRKEESEVLEKLKHIWDDDEDTDDDGDTVQKEETVEINRYDYRCLLDSDEEKEKNEQ